jgi:hypothetical protein
VNAGSRSRFQRIEAIHPVKDLTGGSLSQQLQPMVVGHGVDSATFRQGLEVRIDYTLDYTWV